MRTALLLAISTLALASCGGEKLTPEEQAAEDARARQMVEEVNNGVVIPIAPQAITYPDIEENELYGVSCAFVPEGGGVAAIMLAMLDKGYMKLDGEMVRLSADKGSVELPYGARSRYFGKEYSVNLALDEDSERQVAAESVNYDGGLTVKDAQGNTVYEMAGAVQCGS